MSPRTTWRLAVLIPALAIGFTTVTEAQVQLNPKALVYQTPDQYKWREPTNTGPNNGASLWGDANKEGDFYGGITKWNKGNNFSKPHFHPYDRFIFVLNGTWWVGSGTAWDKDSSVPMKAGTFVTHFANGVHWDGAKQDEDAVLLIMGKAPAASKLATETEGKMGPLNPAAVTYITPDQRKWRDPADKSPTNAAMLVGDQSKTGFYAYINVFKPGASSRPHYHPNDRYITVLKGTWWVGTGNKHDMNATVPLKAGTVVTHFKNEIHYDGAKDEEAVVLIVGEGPGTSVQAEAK